jgi:hypothetical protein
MSCVVCASRLAEITANVLCEMACGYQKQGDRTNAKECFERAAASCLSVAAAREENGDLEAAVVFYRKSAFGYEEARGHALGKPKVAARTAREVVLAFPFVSFCFVTTA